jgi:hypothetical protein
MSNARKWTLAIGIAIVLAMFVNYGIQTFYKAPVYENYCPQQFYPVAPLAKFENCSQPAVDQQVQKNCTDSKGQINYHYDAFGCPTNPFCDTCNRDWTAAQNNYNKNVFIFLAAIGALSIIAGVLLKVDSVAIGLLIGGIVNIIIGTVRYWGGLQDVGRFLVLGVLLALLVWVGIKKVRD